MTSDLLATVTAAARRSAEARATGEAGRAVERLAAAREPRPGVFRRALAAAGPRVIAECKRRSPSRGILRHDYDPAAIAASYAAAGAAAISVLTEPTFFDGSLDHLRAVRDRVGIPVLRKDFIVTEFQVAEARAAGADAVLLIVGALDQASLVRLVGIAKAQGLDALVEVHDEDELARAVDAGAELLGVNSRNLRTLDVSLDVLDRVAPAIPSGVVGVAESGIRSADDVRRLSALGYDAFLIGERFMREPDPGAELARLIDELSRGNDANEDNDINDDNDKNLGARR